MVGGCVVVASTEGVVGPSGPHVVVGAGPALRTVHRCKALKAVEHTKERAVQGSEHTMRGHCKAVTHKGEGSARQRNIQ